MTSANILIVDDNEKNLNLLHDMILSLGHTPLLAANGLSALTQIRKCPPDLVLLDILMPKMDGYEVLSLIKKNNDLRHIPVVMISALEEIESVAKCIKIGADDCLCKPINPTLLKARISSCLEKKSLYDQEKNYRLQIEDYTQNLEERVRAQVQNIASAHLETIFAMAKLAESRDPETGEHIQRMSEYCKILCKELQLFPKYASVIDEHFISNMGAASPLHDIGKVGIPDKILLKPGKLTVDEFDIIKTHTTIGAETLREVYKKHHENIFVCVGIEIAESHHEKWDGTGYPNSLASENIPLAARILALGDVYDALTSRRCYKEPFSHDKSREIIISDRGKHFDPDIVDAFVASEDEFVVVRKRFVDSEKNITLN